MDKLTNSVPGLLPPQKSSSPGTHILIGITCYSKKKYCIDEFIKALKELDKPVNTDIIFIDNSKTEDYANYIRSKGFKVLRSRKLINSYETLKEAYNVLRGYFLEKGYTHLFSLEQDIIAPKQALTKLLSHNKDIISGLYYLGDTPCVMVGKSVKVPPGREREFRFEKTYFNYDFIDKEKLETDKLLEVYCAGLGCMLIKRNILEKIRFRVWNNGGIYRGDCDMYFSQDVRQRKIPIYLDPTIKCGHLNYF